MKPAPRSSAVTVDAAIFDVDGTLIDSVDFHAMAWVEAFAHFGQDTPFEKVRHQIGKGGDNLLPVFLTDHQIDSFGDTLEHFRGDLFKHKYLHMLRPFSGVRTLFERLIGDGVKVALASSAKPDELKIYKRIAEIEDLLDAETSSEDADTSKPAPDIFEAAVKQLGDIAKDRIVVFGDTPYDAEAAVKAGLRCCGVLCGGFSSEDLTTAGCADVYRDPSNILVNYGAVFPRR